VCKNVLSIGGPKEEPADAGYEVLRDALNAQVKNSLVTLFNNDFVYFL
jgi:hypothetical protein